MIQQTSTVDASGGGDGVMTDGAGSGTSADHPQIRAVSQYSPLSHNVPPDSLPSQGGIDGS